ncbi:hypothetical protein FNW52_18965 [Flavobacterium sp. ZT3R18]|uniref:hypothetical protein n=1 Tax=Flavobacterium sp. ZT3R18 TaxID=2594429 RepID=UPI00117B4820|nr:hypothetical protein [Flavobacterium sp. ZT3R18]TRX31197.1 hypothetical protein FNW52_18965 [Flavobacterium sp. ZT3R18]
MKKTTPIILSLITNESEISQESISVKENAQQCSNLIFIDIDTIKFPERDNWKLKNKKYFSASQSINQKKIKIDLTKIVAKNFPAWLVENQDFISYELTSDCIECVHTITDLDLQKDIDNLPVHSTLQLKDIKKQITVKKGDFNTEKYNKYVSFYVDGDKIAVNLIPFDAEKNCFSFPLLRTIASKYLDDQSVFEFKILDDSSKRTVVFTIQTENRSISYFNFSHIPPIVDYETIFAL